MLKAGQAAPDFTLPSAEGEQVNLLNIIKKGPVIVFFYPADFSPACTLEACNIRDVHEDIAAAGMTVVGISTQGSASHRRFKQAFELPYLLLSDKDKTVIKAYGINGPLGIGLQRATFLINQDGIIEDAVHAELRIDQHKAFITRAIELQGRPTA
jgi:peroxiredoxin Q/BCP